MKIAFAILALSLTLRAKDAPKPNPELDAAKAHIAILQQALDAMTNKSQACFALYQSDMALANLLPKLQALTTQSVDPANGSAGKPEAKGEKK